MYTTYRVKLPLIIIIMKTPDQPRLQIDCFICTTLADEAVVTACCTTIICRACFDEWNSKNKQCPLCRTQNCIVNNESFVRKLCQEASPQIQFFVKSFTRTITLKMKQLDPVQMLYQRIHQRQGIEISQIRLSFNGKNVDKSKKSLRSHKLTDNSTVILLGRLKGGTNGQKSF